MPHRPHRVALPVCWTRTEPSGTPSTLRVLRGVATDVEEAVPIVVGGTGVAARAP
ncbi:hypothetical protein ACSCBZ_19570 [Streptomyces niveiscabiei]|uniref:hypothetical protein n=1 Tax=Streptomyces niveiscabiei TaxID=164115 RepID=UPI000B2B611A|nr:hypothetical protein [Streptomyces niveiscabiei]